PMIAESSPAASQESAILVMRSLVPALLIIPVQSVTRGLFQGHNRMREPAISQIIEQLLRVIFILGSAYIVRQVLAGKVVLETRLLELVHLVNYIVLQVL